MIAILPSSISLPYNHGASLLSFPRSGFLFPFVFKAAKMDPKLSGRSDNGSFLKTYILTQNNVGMSVINRRKIERMSAIAVTDQ